MINIKNALLIAILMLVAMPVYGASVLEDPVIGNKNAPLEVIWFADYQDPFDARFNKETMPLLMQEYVNTDKVKIVVKDFPLDFHTNARKAAQAANCAMEQGKYAKYKDKLFENQEEWAELGSEQAISMFKLYFSQILQTKNKDAAKFNACMDSGKYEAEIEDDISEGMEKGVSGVPTFFIGDQVLTGMQPFENFKRIIEENLYETRRYKAEKDIHKFGFTFKLIEKLDKKNAVFEYRYSVCTFMEPVNGSSGSAGCGSIFPTKIKGAINGDTWRVENNDRSRGPLIKARLAPEKGRVWLPDYGWLDVMRKGTVEK